MFKLLKNENGVTMIELITVMVISTMLIMVSAVGISTFFRSYKRLNDFIDLQKEAMECLDTIKNGYAVGRGDQFYGVNNAKTLTITNLGAQEGWGTGIKITPPITSALQAQDMIRFYYSDKAVKASYIYNGVQVDRPVFIFPKRQDRDKIEVTKFAVADGNSGNISLPPEAVGLSLLKVELEARVMVKDSPFPNQIEYRTIKYRTYMVRKR